jgi:transcriptional regulator with XRE-family HTH domain
MAQPRHDWYLKEWLKASRKKQSDLVKDLEWNKAKASLLANGKQAYSRDDVNEVADYLNVRPFELLMHPDDAHAMRRLKAEMIRLVHENRELEEELNQPDSDAQKKVSLN